MNSDADQFQNGVSVGRMFSTSPYWWMGYFLGQMFGAYEDGLKRMTGVVPRGSDS